MTRTRASRSVAVASVVVGLVIPGSLLLASPAQAAPCQQFTFNGLQILNQDNGYRVEFVANGTTIDNAPTTQFNNQQAAVDRGVATGEIFNREVTIRIVWDKGSVGNYSGSVDDRGKARGTTGPATWNIKNYLACAPSPDAPAPAAPPPVAPPPVVVPPQARFAPLDAVTMDIAVAGLNANVNIASTAEIPGSCTYKATAPLLPAVNKSFDLAANGSTSFSTLAPPLFSTYHVVLSCMGRFDGRTVEFGHVEKDVTATG